MPSPPSPSIFVHGRCLEVLHLHLHQSLSPSTGSRLEVLRLHLVIIRPPHLRLSPSLSMGSRLEVLHLHLHPPLAPSFAVPATSSATTSYSSLAAPPTLTPSSPIIPTIGPSSTLLVLFGVSAGLLWTGQRAIMASCPHPCYKGPYVFLFLAIFNLGGIFGGATLLRLDRQPPRSQSPWLKLCFSDRFNRRKVYNIILITMVGCAIISGLQLHRQLCFPMSRSYHRCSNL